MRVFRKYLRFWYTKWIKGECRHFCRHCKFRFMGCEDEMSR